MVRFTLNIDSYQALRSEVKVMALRVLKIATGKLMTFCEVPCELMVRIITSIYSSYALYIEVEGGRGHQSWTCHYTCNMYMYQTCLSHAYYMYYSTRPYMVMLRIPFFWYDNRSTHKHTYLSLNYTWHDNTVTNQVHKTCVSSLH